MARTPPNQPSKRRTRSERPSSASNEINSTTPPPRTPRVNQEVNGTSTPSNRVIIPRANQARSSSIVSGCSSSSNESPVRLNSATAQEDTPRSSTRLPPTPRAPENEASQDSSMTPDLQLQLTANNEILQRLQDYIRRQDDFNARLEQRFEELKSPPNAGKERNRRLPKEVTVSCSLFVCTFIADFSVLRLDVSLSFTP